MKKILLFVAILFVAHISYGQIFSFGLKAGVNSSKISFSDFSVDKMPTVSIDNGVLFGYITEQIQNGNLVLDENNKITIADGAEFTYPEGLVDVTAPSVKFTPSSYEMGYHFGAFARFKILGIFLQPEIIFSQTNASINLDPEGFDATQLVNEVSSSKITYTNFDVPVMLGFKLGPAHLCAGPVATFKLNSKVDDATKKFLDEIESENGVDVFTVTKNATFGAQVGAGLTLLKKVTVDVRYEFGLSKLGDKVTIAGNEFNTDQRGSQFIASVGWMF